MEKKRVLIVLLLCFFIALSIINIIAVTNYFSLYGIKVTGKSLSGLVRLFVEGGERTIEIISPENTTYNFSIGDTYILDLNVSALNFDVDTWWYTLLDLKHDTTVDENIELGTGVNSVNTTISVVRWSNKVAVYANDSEGTIFNTNVTFFVYVPNSAPIIEFIDPYIYICENQELNYYFNVTDVDEDDNGDLESDIVPSNPFFVFPLTYSLSSGENRTLFRIISGELNKTHATSNGNGWKVYEENVSIKDNYNAMCCSDSNQTSITVIEINNPPDVTSMDNQTVWTVGDNGTFYHQLQVTDTENGNQDSGNLTFNITIFNSTGSVVNLFNISQNGTMSYTADAGDIGVYNVSVCVNDSGINNPHSRILVECGQTGVGITSCQNFSLTITDENRAPTIINYYPLSLILNVSGTDSLYFNITKYDGDGTVPDASWYVDGVFRELDSGSLVDEFTFSFGCSVSGNRKIKVEITDGLLTDILQWNLSVSLVECPLPEEEDKGSSMGVQVCVEEWVCYDWGICQHAEKSLEAGRLYGEDYRAIKNNCSENRWEEEFCGFQTRECSDLRSCNTTYRIPEKIQGCYYTEDPSCYDGIKNCHGGVCEFLVDCGGPCPPCPTCSDSIQNQGETGVDCGGPCPWTCAERPLVRRTYLQYILLILILIIVILVIIKLRSIFKIKKKIKKKISHKINK